MKNALTALVVIALVPLHALAQAATFSVLWSWFVQPRFGAGPGYPAWYGLSLVFGLALAGALSGFNVKRDNDRTLPAAIGVTVGLMLSYAAVLGIAWCTGNILGWA